MKPYPACRHTHCGIDAALELRKTIDPLKIRKIELFLYHNAIPAVGIIRVPKSTDDAKFSICYSVAAALLKGRFSFEELQVDSISDEMVSLIEKITLIEDNDLENVQKGIRGARMRIHLDDGDVRETTVLIPKGDAANPFTWNDVADKFRSCAETVLSEKAVTDIIAFVRNKDISCRFAHPEEIRKKA